jgi:hypothetical protein
MNLPTAKRTDITKQVRGRIENGHIVLYYYNRKIGSIPMDSVEIKLNQGFEAHSHLIYRLSPATDTPSSYAENCDLGWC